MAVALPYEEGEACRCVYHVCALVVAFWALIEAHSLSSIR